MLVAWTSENDNADWTVQFVQFRKNSSSNAEIKQSPYATLFGIEARIGLTSSSLPHDVIQKLQTEDDLLAILPTSSTQPDTLKQLNLYQKQLNLYQKQQNLYQKQLNLYQKRAA